ncbi:hypothetical protein N8Z24_00250 [bacterium]|nr:hypothetical protein [bacterium]
MYEKQETLAEKKARLAKKVKEFTPEELEYHEAMLNAGFTPELLGSSLIYTRSVEGQVPAQLKKKGMLSIILESLRFSFWR